MRRRNLGTGVLAATCLAVVAGADVRGRVLLDDGVPPAQPIPVELICPGRASVRFEADERGRFDFPAPPGGAAECTVRASLPGYGSDSVAVKRLPLDPEIGGLSLRREGKWQGFALSPTSLAVNDAARVSFARAAAAMRDGGTDSLARAEALLVEAVEADPTYTEAWFELGRLRLARGEVSAARAALEGALAADAWFISPYRPLLLIEMAEERWSKAVALCDRLLRLTPDLSDALYYRALANLELGRVAAAWADAKAIERGPEGPHFALLHHLRGLLFERGGRREAAVAEFHQYLEAEPDGPAAADVRARLEAAP